MSQSDALFVVTASFTDDGAPAYLTADGGWSRALQDAQPMHADAQERQVAERSAHDQRAVCDPYAFKVEVTAGVIDPLTAREHIRAKGPTTRLRRPD